MDYQWVHTVIRLVQFATLSLFFATSAYATDYVLVASGTGSTTGNAAGPVYTAPMGGILAKSATRTTVYGACADPNGCTLNGFKIYDATDPGAGKTVTMTVYVGASASSITCTITGGGAAPFGCEDPYGTHTASVAYQGNWSIGITTNAGTSGRYSAIMYYSSGTANLAPLTGNSKGNLPAGTTYMSLAGNGTANATPEVTMIMVPFDMTVMGLCLELQTGTGAGSRDFTLQKQGADTTSVVTFPMLTAASTICDTTHTIAYTKGQTLNLKHIPTNLPANSIAVASLVYTPTHAGDYLIPYNGTLAFVNNAVRYVSPGVWDDAGTSMPTATATSARSLLGPTMAITGACAAAGAALNNAGSAYTIALMNATTAAPATPFLPLNNLQFAIADPASANCYSAVGTPTDAYPIADQLWGIRVTPSGTPTAVTLAISLAANSTFTACPSNNVLVDHGAGVDTATVTAAAIDASTFGIAGSNTTMVIGNQGITFATAAHRALPGSGLITQCNNAWPGEGNSTVGMKVAMNNTPGTPTYAKEVFPASVTGVVVANVVFSFDATAPKAILPDVFTVFGSGGNNYTNVGINGNGSAFVFYLESKGLGGCTGHGSTFAQGIAALPSTDYVLSVLMSPTTAGNNVLTVYNTAGTQLGQVSTPTCYNETPLNVSWGFVASSTTDTGYNLFYDKVTWCGVFNEGATCPNLLYTLASSSGVSDGLLLGVR